MSSKWPLQFPVIKAASSVKIKVVSVSLGLALLGILAAYFRRKKKRVQSQNVKRQVPDGSEQSNRLHHISYSNGGSYMTTLASLEIIINGEQNCLLNEANTIIFSLKMVTIKKIVH